MSTERERDAAVDELLHLLLDELGPVVVAHRREVARRVDLHPDDLLCLDLLRRLGPLPAGALAGWLGVTRSAISKVVRRLESGGHVERHVRAGRRQEIEVVRRSHPERDAVLDSLRDDVRHGVAALVVDHRLGDPGRLAPLAGAIVGLQDVLRRHTRDMTDTVAHEALLVRRRRERLSAPDCW